MLKVWKIRRYFIHGIIIHIFVYKKWKTVVTLSCYLRFMHPFAVSFVVGLCGELPLFPQKKFFRPDVRILFHDGSGFALRYQIGYNK